MEEYIDLSRFPAFPSELEWEEKHTLEVQVFLDSLEEQGVQTWPEGRLALQFRDFYWARALCHHAWRQRRGVKARLKLIPQMFRPERVQALLNASEELGISWSVEPKNNYEWATEFMAGQDAEAVKRLLDDPPIWVYAEVEYQE